MPHNARLPHGQWLSWIEQNLGMDERTARKFISVAEWSKANRPPEADLNYSVQLLLAAPRVAQEIVSAAVQAATDRVRTRLTSMGQDAVVIGMDLQLIKDGLPHGQWLPWIEQNFGMTAEHAQRFMQVADWSRSNTTPALYLGQTVQMLLAAPRMEPEVREQVTEQIVTGESFQWS